MTKPAPKRAPARVQDRASKADPSGEQTDRDHDQGIRRDQRGQDQPKDKDRAQT